MKSERNHPHPTLSLQGRGVQKPKRRRGTAMIEFTMCIPLIALIVGLTFFFGYAMLNQQHVVASSRYAAWADVMWSRPSTQELDALFFSTRAQNVDVVMDNDDPVPGDAVYGLIDVSENVSEAAGDLADKLMLTGDTINGVPQMNFPGGREMHVSAEFPTTVGLWQMFKGPIRAKHVRDGVEWRRRQASCESEVADLFLSDFDGPVDNPLWEILEGLYLQRW